MKKIFESIKYRIKDRFRWWRNKDVSFRFKFLNMLSGDRLRLYVGIMSSSFDVYSKRVKRCFPIDANIYCKHDILSISELEVENSINDIWKI